MGSELAREKMWSRIHLIPLLTAEEDRDLVRRHYADQAREKELLGSQTSPYNSDRYVIRLVFSLVLERHLLIEVQIRTTYIRNHTESKIEIKVKSRLQVGMNVGRE